MHTDPYTLIKIVQHGYQSTYWLELRIKKTLITSWIWPSAIQETPPIPPQMTNHEPIPQNWFDFTPIIGS
jgi:hypothetical protein